MKILKCVLIISLFCCSTGFSICNNGLAIIFLKIDKSFSKTTDWDSFAFSGNNEFTIADDGSVYVVEKQENKVYKFDKNGKFLFSFGKSGQGPGEFQHVGNISVKGDLVCIGDYATRKLVHIFNQQGKFLYMVNTPKPCAYNYLLNEKLILLWCFDGHNNNYSLIKQNIESKTSAIVLDNIVENKDVHKITLNNIQINIADIFANRFLWNIVKNNICVGYSKSNKLTFYSFSGEKVKEFAIKKQLQKLDKKAKNLAYKQTLEKSAHVFKRFKIHLKFDDLIYSKTYPLYSHILSDSQGNILVIDFKYPTKSKNNELRFQKYSPDGKFLGDYAFVNDKFKQLQGYNIEMKMHGDSLYIFMENTDNEDEPYYEVVKFDMKIKK